jgi:hypothetical protein
MTSDTPDALTLDEVLEQMLPYFDDDAFEVARWLGDHIERAKVRLLADGVAVPPHRYTLYLAVTAKIAPDGRASLFVELKRAFGLGEGGHTPVKQWTVERKSFDIHFGPLRDRKRRPSLERDCWLLIEAAAYVVENGLPEPPSAETLWLELRNIHGERCPGRTVALGVLGPFMQRMKDVLKR